MAEQKRVWLYGRVAHDDGITLAVQMDLLRHWTAEHGYAIVGETAETGSGIRPDRPGFSAVMQAADQESSGRLRAYGDTERVWRCLICTDENFIPDLLVTRF